MYAKYHVHHAYSWSSMVQYQPYCVFKSIVIVELVVIVLMAPFVDVVAGLLSAGCCPAEDITDRSPPQSSQPSHPVYPCNAQFSFKLVSPHSPPPPPPKLPTPYTRSLGQQDISLLKCPKEMIKFSCL